MMSPAHYVRAYLLLQKDLIDLFDFVEPSDQNLSSYSYRIHALLIRACIEVEANCKAILGENGYTKSGDLNMSDYRKIENSHRLSEYQVKFPIWTGAHGIRKPFSAWGDGNTLGWYRAYNASKHDRHSEFPTATFSVMLDAISACLVILSAQFLDDDFAGGPNLIVSGRRTDSFDYAIGGYLTVAFPTSWRVEDRYEFNWNELSKYDDPFNSLWQNFLRGR